MIHKRARANYAARRRTQLLGPAARAAAMQHGGGHAHKSVRQFFDALRDVPWLALTTVAILAGASVLFHYFNSIGHIPSDFATLTGLGITTAAVALGLLLTAAVLLALPAISARMITDADLRSAAPFSATEVLSIQIAGAGLLLSYALYRDATDCGTPLPIAIYWTTALALLGLGHVGVIHARILKGITFFRVLRSVLIGVMALAPLLAILPIRDIFGEGDVNLELLLISGFLASVAVNAAAVAWQATVPQLVIGSLFVASFMHVAIPLTFERSAAVSSTVANAIGIRSSGPVTALLSKSGCMLVQAAAGPSPRSAAIVCERDGANEVPVWVLSNVGARWVLGLHWDRSSSGLPTTSVTVPASEINVVSPMPGDAHSKTCVRPDRGVRA